MGDWDITMRVKIWYCRGCQRHTGHIDNRCMDCGRCRLDR
jgi:hypothetical protein